MLAAVFTGLVAGLVAGLVPVSPVIVDAAGPDTLAVTGRGNGHGIGMSQWGAYGYAADQGWNAGQILDHYYGGTVSGTIVATSISVRLMLLDDRQTSLVHDRGALVVDGVPGGPWRSLVMRETSQRSYTVWARTDASVCPSAAQDLTEWAVVASGLTSVTVRPQTETSASADPADLVAVCEPGGRVRSYRGAIRAVNGTDGENRTVNEVPLEQYLRSVVASEMSASWAPRGMQALMAQAVAARSFALAENRYSYAKTCDQICQFYPGAAWRSSPSAGSTRVEQSPIDTAVAATAGMVRRLGSTAGPVALTMFSSSSGGWTAASTLAYPAVEDLGDAVTTNPHHRWTASVAATAVEAAWPSIGDYLGVTVTSRSGQGEWGGRVLGITVQGSAGSVSLTGDAFRRAIGLRSNWFDVAGANASTGSASTGSTSTGSTGSPASPVAASGRCGGRDEPAVVGIASDAPAARFDPIVPVRLVDTRVGTGTTVAPLVGGCTLVVRPAADLGADLGLDIATVSAVAVNIVTVDPQAQGFITAAPCGIARPFTSVVQSQVGRIVSGSAVVSLGADGTFCVYSNITTDIVIDMTGSYTPAGSSRYEPIVAQRRYDSRSGGRLAAGTVVRIPTRGPGAAVGDSNAASLTIHALDAVQAGFITAWPCDAPRPWASSANVNAGGSVSNYADVASGATGEVCVFVSAPMHLAIDLNGWFGPSASTEFHAVVPVRVADTREGQAWGGQFTRNVPRRLAVASLGGLPGSGVVRAVTVQLTAVSDPLSESASGWVTVHPCLERTPDLSMLRYPARTNVAVQANSIVSDTGEWCVLASSTTHLVVDVSGWFG